MLYFHTQKQAIQKFSVPCIYKMEYESDKNEAPVSDHHFSVCKSMEWIR